VGLAFLGWGEGLGVHAREGGVPVLGASLVVLAELALVSGVSRQY